MDYKIKAGSTSRIIDLFIIDTSKSDGSGLTGLVYNSAGLSCYYRVEGTASWTAVSLVTATAGTYTSSGFKESDATNAPGVYELGIPNAALTGGKSVTVMLKGATNMRPTLQRIELDAVDYQSATAFITGVNSVAPPTNWNLMAIDASGRVDIGKLLGTAWLAPGTAGTPDVNVKLWNGLTTVALPLVPTVAGRTLDVSTGGEAGIDWANVGSPTTPVGLTGTTISTGQTITSVSGAVGSVTSGVTVTTNNDKTGYSLSSSGLNLVLVAGVTLPNALKYIGAAVAGVITTSQTTSEVFKDFAGTTALTVTVDSSGNRSAITYA